MSNTIKSFLGNIVISRRLCRDASIVTLVAASCCVGHRSSAQEAPTAARNAGFTKLSFQDEFGGNRVNDNVWAVRTRGGDHDGKFASDTVQIEDGKLKIRVYTARRNGKSEHRIGWLETDPSRKYQAAHYGASFTGLEKTLGYVEARINFNKRRGMWGAFWLQASGNKSSNARRHANPNTFAATYGAEIDIVEAISKHKVNGSYVDYKERLVSNIHWNGYAKPEDRTVRNSDSAIRDLIVEKSARGLDAPKASHHTSLYNEWHVYGLLWTRDKYAIYLDNTLMGEITDGVSHQPEFIRLTTQVNGGSFAGEIPDAEYESGRTRMEVDWVRWWQ